LKKAGYATSPTYAEALIRIIEENELYQYDRIVLSGGEYKPEDLEMGSRYAGREIMERNRIEYVIAQPGDTPESLRDELDLYRNEIYRYNDMDRTDRIEPGQIIYLQPKRRKAEKGNAIHIAEEGENMYDISQQYGVKLKHLYRMNLMDEGDYLAPGTEVHLRKRKRAPLIQQEEEDKSTEEIMKFEFRN
jgi:hypothetical protein